MNHLNTATPIFTSTIRPFKRADPHNFGRYVTQVDSNYIHKPRSIFWEWLFLGDSPLRTILESHPSEIFKSLPLLCFNSENYNHGNVELCEVSSLESLSELNIIQAGAVIGLMSYFGITDLHKDNVVCGNINGRFVFGPLDIETIFDNVRLPAQTLLLPSRLIDRNRCGTSALFDSQTTENLNPKVIFKLTFGFLSALDFLEANSSCFLEDIANFITKYNPVIRRVLRPTKDYYSFAENQETVNSAMTPSELIQISRGDIPYYFKYTNTDEVYFYSNENLSEYKPVDHHEFNKTGIIENLTFDDFSKTLGARLDALRTNGTLQILRLIPAEVKPQHFVMDGLSVYLTSNDIIVESKTKAFKCSRVGR